MEEQAYIQNLLGEKHTKLCLPQFEERTVFYNVEE